MKSEMVELMKLIESKQFMAHANSILEAETDSNPQPVQKVTKNVPLTERLDEYYEDENLMKKPNLTNFPPNFAPIPCKPLFFDLAREHVEFPDLEKKIAGPKGNSASQQGASGGWLGGWLGWGKK